MEQNLLNIISPFSYGLNYLYSSEIYCLFYAARYPPGLLTMLYSNHRGLGDTSGVKSFLTVSQRGRGRVSSPQANEVQKTFSSYSPDDVSFGLWICVLKLSF